MGALDSSSKGQIVDIADVFTEITHYTVKELHTSAVGGLAQHLWDSVSLSSQKKSPMHLVCPISPSILGSCSTLNCIGDLTLTRKERLIFDLDAARAGIPFDGSKNRPSELWFQSGFTLQAPMEPLEGVFTEC